MRSENDLLSLESQRIMREHARRDRELPPDVYAPWRADEMFLRTGRRRVAAALLRQAGAFPQATDDCLEIGCGSLGWLGELLCWGVSQSHLHGIDLEAARVERARELLPAADLRVGDAASLPWRDDTFPLVVASTVFSSILDEEVRRRVAREIHRVLMPGGVLLWYDFFVNNPRNSNVRAVRRTDLPKLFPGLTIHARSVTLAPPLARSVARWSWTLATLLEGIPFLRTHLLAVLRKGPKGRPPLAGGVAIPADAGDERPRER